LDSSLPQSLVFVTFSPLSTPASCIHPSQYYTTFPLVTSSFLIYPVSHHSAAPSGALLVPFSFVIFYFLFYFRRCSFFFFIIILFFVHPVLLVSGSSIRLHSRSRIARAGADDSASLKDGPRVQLNNHPGPSTLPLQTVHTF
jgi:hypothetical protein